MLDWTDILLRVLAAVGVALGAYQGIKWARADDKWSAGALVLSVAAMTAYVCGAVAMVIVYGVLVAWDYFIVFMMAATLYVVGGFYGCFKLIIYLKSRLPPAGRKLSSN